MKSYSRVIRVAGERVSIGTRLLAGAALLPHVLVFLTLLPLLVVASLFASKQRAEKGGDADASKKRGPFGPLISAARVCDQNLRLSVTAHSRGRPGWPSVWPTADCWSKRVRK